MVPNGQVSMVFLIAGCKQLRLCHWTVQILGAAAAGARQSVQLPSVTPHQVFFLQEHLLCIRAVLLPVLQWIQWTSPGGRHQCCSLQCGLHQYSHSAVRCVGSPSHQLLFPHPIPPGGFATLTCVHRTSNRNLCFAFCCSIVQHATLHCCPNHGIAFGIVTYDMQHLRFGVRLVPM